MVTTPSSNTPSFRGKNIFFFFLAAILLFYGIHATQTWQQHRDQNKVEMKSSGKSGKHANPKAKQSANEKYREAKSELEKLHSKGNKTPEEKAALEKWRIGNRCGTGSLCNCLRFYVRNYDNLYDV